MLKGSKILGEPFPSSGQLGLTCPNELRPKTHTDPSTCRATSSFKGDMKSASLAKRSPGFVDCLKVPMQKRMPRWVVILERARLGTFTQLSCLNYAKIVWVRIPPAKGCLW